MFKEGAPLAASSLPVNRYVIAPRGYFYLVFLMPAPKSIPAAGAATKPPMLKASGWKSRCRTAVRVVQMAVLTEVPTVWAKAAPDRPVYPRRPNYRRDRGHSHHRRPRRCCWPYLLPSA